VQSTDAELLGFGGDGEDDSDMEDEEEESDDEPPPAAAAAAGEGEGQNLGLGVASTRGGISGGMVVWRGGQQQARVQGSRTALRLGVQQLEVRA
jgi:uncharacterized protein HemX